jgi:DNA polymerase-3 subunit alpha
MPTSGLEAVDMTLPGRFKVSPQIAGAIKAVAGVVDVQTL